MAITLKTLLCMSSHLVFYTHFPVYFDKPCMLKSILIPSMGMNLKLGLSMLVGLWTCPNDKRHYIYTYLFPLTNAFNSIALMILGLVIS